MLHQVVGKYVGEMDLGSELATHARSTPALDGGPCCNKPWLFSIKLIHSTEPLDDCGAQPLDDCGAEPVVFEHVSTYPKLV